MLTKAPTNRLTLLIKMSKTFLAVLSCLVVESVSPHSPQDHTTREAYQGKVLVHEETKPPAEVIDKEAFAPSDAAD